MTYKNLQKTIDDAWESRQKIGVNTKGEITLIWLVRRVKHLLSETYSEQLTERFLAQHKNLPKDLDEACPEYPNIDYAHSSEQSC